MLRSPFVVYPNEYPLDKQEAALWLAAKGGNLSEVIQLIACKKDIEERGGYMHFSPLAIASRNGHICVIEELLQHHADLRSIDSYFSETPLHSAVRHYNSRVKNPSGVHDQKTCPSNATTLNVAKKCELNVAASMLIDAMALKGVTLDSTDECGRTVLHLAVSDRNEPIVRRLLDNGADISMKDVSGSTVLKYSIMENDMHFVSVLIEYGADINEIYNYGRMPLHLCIERHLNALSDLLLKHGADIEAVDYGGSNALALASQYGFGVEMIRESGRRAGQLKVESK